MEKKTTRIMKYVELITAVLLCQIELPCVFSQRRVSIIGIQDKAINTNFVIKTLDMAGQSFDFCLARCLEDCLCKSFQVCDSSKCELSSIEKEEDMSMFQTRSGCVYYNLEALNPRDQQCDQSCSRSINCCLTSNPCFHGGVCHVASPVPSTTSRSRFSCKCPQPYTGRRCNQAIRSCRGYKNGPRISGIHEILDNNGTAVKVYCDFDSSTSLAWTLIQSHVRDARVKSLELNDPRSPDRPSWTGYRLQKSRMLSIQDHSTKWRITCQHHGKTPLTDYVYGAIKDIDILKSIVNCAKVKFIKIRNVSCSDCTVHFFQNTGHTLHHSVASYYKKCEFNVTQGAEMTCNGKYFGLYSCKDKNHTCSSSANATTQTWFGG